MSSALWRAGCKTPRALWLLQVAESKKTEDKTAVWEAGLLSFRRKSEGRVVNPAGPGCVRGNHGDGQEGRPKDGSAKGIHTPIPGTWECYIMLQNKDTTAVIT